MWLDGRDLAGPYPHRRQLPEGVGGSVHQGHGTHPKAPEWAGWDWRCLSRNSLKGEIVHNPVDYLSQEFGVYGLAGFADGRQRVPFLPKQKDGEGQVI